MQGVASRAGAVVRDRLHGNADGSHVTGLLNMSCRRTLRIIRTVGRSVQPRVNSRVGFAFHGRRVMKMVQGLLAGDTIMRVC